MDRRDFLKAGAAGVALAGPLAACTPARAPAPPPAALMAPADLSAFLARVDSGMAAIGSGTPLRAVLADVAPTARVEPGAYDEAEEMYRKSLRMMLLAGSYRDLPEDARAHPDVKRRIDGALGEMDQAVVGMTRHLETLSRDARAAIQQRLKDDPDLPMRMAEALDRQAAVVGVTMQRRLHLRSITAQVSWRLRAQPISTFIDEHAAKVRSIAQRQREALIDHYASESPPDAPTGDAPGTGPMKIGGILLGVGAALLLLGGAACATSSGSSSGCITAAVFLLTPGVAIAVAGLITLLVGLIIRAAKS